MMARRYVPARGNVVWITTLKRVTSKPDTALRSLKKNLKS